MKTIRITFLIAMIGFFITPLQAQYTKQQAIDLVLNNILSNELNQVDVYMLDITKSNQNNILLGDRTTINLPYSNNWVCFVDDNPFANWAHSCRYILIDEASGNYQIVP